MYWGEFVKKDYYSFEEVFLGLREEYLRNRTELEKLKNYIICEDKRVEDYYLWLYGSDVKNNPDLWISSKEKNGQLLDFFRNLFGTYYIGRDENLVIWDEEIDDIRIMKNIFQYNLSSDYMEKLQLKREMNRISDNDFIRNMPLEVSRIGYNHWLHFTLARLEVKWYEECFIYYSTDKESIHWSNMTRINEILTEGNILNAKIPKKYFSEYHQKVIESNDRLKKIEIADNFLGFGKRVELELMEDEDRFILSKKRLMKR